MLRRGFFRLLSTLFTIALFVATAAAQTPEPTHIVFDLDWTLINSTTRQMAEARSENILLIDGEYYRLSESAVDILIFLHQITGVRISYFSGGAKQRNEQAIKFIYNKISEKLGHSQFQPHLVLNVENLTAISENADLKFSERFKKNLGKFFNLNRTLLVEDVKNFVMKGQESLVLWLGKTYNDRPDYKLQHLEDPAEAKYSAPDYQTWLENRDKLVRALGIIVETLKSSVGTESLSQSLQAVLQKERAKRWNAYKAGFGALEIFNLHQRAPIFCRSAI